MRPAVFLTTLSALPAATPAWHAEPLHKPRTSPGPTTLQRATRIGSACHAARNGTDPAPFDAGWKDTVDLRPYEVVEVLVRFTGFRGRYVLHCHNLEHEDMAMMANVDVI